MSIFMLENGKGAVFRDTEIKVATKSKYPLVSLAVKTAREKGIIFNENPNMPFIKEKILSRVEEIMEKSIEEDLDVAKFLPHVGLAVMAIGNDPDFDYEFSIKDYRRELAALIILGRAFEEYGDHKRWAIDISPFLPDTVEVYHHWRHSEYLEDDLLCELRSFVIHYDSDENAYYVAESRWDCTHQESQFIESYTDYDYKSDTVIKIDEDNLYAKAGTLLEEVAASIVEALIETKLPSVINAVENILSTYSYFLVEHEAIKHLE